MKKILQIRTSAKDALSEEVATADRASGAQLRVVCLDPDGTDYQQLLQAIYEADSVQCW